MTANDARELFSEYVDEMLDDDEKDRLQAFLAGNPDSAAELMAFQRTISMIHRLPPHEPVLDTWAEFAPKVTEFLAEQKQTPVRKIALACTNLRSVLSAGVILWTQALAQRALAKLEGYVHRDTLHDLENQ